MSTSTSENHDTHQLHIPGQRRGPSLDDPRASLPRHSASRYLRFLPVLACVVDLVAISAAEVSAAAVRLLLPAMPADSTDYVPHLLAAGPVVAVGWILILALSGAYSRSVFGVGMEEFKRVLTSSVVAATVVGVGCYLLRFELSRGWSFLTLLLGALFLLLGRATLRIVVTRARVSGRLQQRVLIVGTPSHVDEINGVLTRERRLGYKTVGAVVPGASGAARTRRGLHVLGDARDVVELATASQSDVVFFAGGSVESASALRHTAAELEGAGVHVVLAPSITDISGERIKVRPVGGLPLIHVGKPRSAAALARMKRTSDIIGSSLLILAFSPVLLFAAIKVRRFDGGPILFRQERIGVGGEPFGCFKFRTMVVDAEAKLGALLREQNADHGLFAKLKDDPRITRPGTWMRRYSVDELPQLFNVFKGDMSLIGPRPQVAHEVAQYDDTTARRLRVRPGMTGLWQVSGRSDLTVEEAIRLDLYYVDNWSMMQDLSILARTFRAVLGSDGAY
ncbi:sugar transferase [Marmoricola sp. Leaf446]|uniref:sugar transferase n=1 Tax=Marmoricola sp. Leaf446 TaxID=1736379 RepID=UPI0012E3318C|nr:sugar transferase [Marmoricola sp. Leaf446]